MVIAGDGLKILIWEFEQEIPSSLMILFGISFFMDFRLLIELPLFCFIGVFLMVCSSGLGFLSGTAVAYGNDSAQGGNNQRYPQEEVCIVAGLGE